MKVCSKCNQEKKEEEFRERRGKRSGIGPWCKICSNRYNTERVSFWAKKLKIELMREHGDVCADCGEKYPPFVMDFDHRDPSLKTMSLSVTGMRNREKAREEAKKCDLVCSNCHRMRTHRQRCSGCEHCTES